MCRALNRLRMSIALALLFGLITPVRGAEVTQGTIKSIAADGDQFVLQDSENEEWTFQCKAACRIICPPKDSGEKDTSTKEKDATKAVPKLVDLRSGGTVTVLYEKQGERLTALAILSNEGANRDALLQMGIVKTVPGPNAELVMTDTDGKEWTFRVADETKVQVGGKPDKIRSLKKEDQVLVVYESKDDKLMAKEICSDRKPERRERE